MYSIDYKIKGNFCKHVHASIRVSNKNNTEVVVDEYKATTVFKEHNNYVVREFQIQSVNPKDSINFKAFYSFAQCYSSNGQLCDR